MPLEPLRFIHAGAARLDQPFQVRGPLPDPVRKIAENATFSALRRTVSIGIEQEVDFLLLTGRAILDEEPSVRTAVALRNAVTRLAEHDIPLCVVPEDDDELEAWRRIPGLPVGISFLSPTSRDSADVLRDDRVLAILGQPESTHRLEASATGLRPLLIGVGEHAAPADYRIGPQRSLCSTSRRGSEVLHSPGPLQAVSRREWGSHGCSLVEVFPGGQLEITRLPVASLRCEQLGVLVPDHGSVDELATEMADLLERVAREPHEKAWVTTWRLFGNGPFWKQLNKPDTQHRLLEDVSSLIGDGSLHQLIEPVWKPVRREDDLFGRYLRELELAAEGSTGEGEMESSPVREAALSHAVALAAGLQSSGQREEVCL